MSNRMHFYVNLALQCMCLSRHSFDDTGSFVFTCSLFFSLLFTLSAFHLFSSFTNDSFFTTRGMNCFTTCNFFTNSSSFTANTQTCFPSTQPRHSVHREVHSTPVGLDNPLLFGILLSPAFAGPPSWSFSSKSSCCPLDRLLFWSPSSVLLSVLLLLSLATSSVL